MYTVLALKGSYISITILILSHYSHIRKPHDINKLVTHTQISNLVVRVYTGDLKHVDCLSNVFFLDSSEQSLQVAMLKVMKAK